MTLTLPSPIAATALDLPEAVAAALADPPPGERAVSEASFRTWLGSFAKETEGLAAGAAAPAKKEDADEKRGR